MRISVQSKVLIVKSLFLLMILFSTGVASPAQNVKSVRENIVRDGVYIGLEKMPNLTPEEPNTQWFHENRLLTRSDEAIVDKVPIYIHHGKKVYSASDGGFLTYRARFVRKDGQSFVVLRLFQSDYVAFRIDKHDQYTEIKTYPVKLVAGSIEFDDVRYTHSPLDKLEVDRLAKLLSTEPLESGTAGP